MRCRLQAIVTNDRSVCHSACHIAQLGFTVQNRSTDQDPDPPTATERGCYGKFCLLWTSYVSEDWLKLET